jgi:superkiller protein 3
LADSDPWRDRARNPRVWNSKRRLARRAREGRDRDAPSRFLGVLGMRLQQLGGDSEALLRAVQRRHPGDFWVNFNLGNALSLNKKPVEATGYFLAALALRPDTPAVLTNIGTALRDQGRLVEAAREFRLVIALDPKQAIPHSNLGTVLKSQGKLAKAVTEHRRAIAIDPNYAPAHNNLGNALQALGRPAEAIEAYRRALTIDPNLPQAHYNLGIVLYHRGRRAAAVKEFRAALALDSKLARVHSHLGRALFDLGRRAEAVKECRRAIALDRNYPAAHSHLATALLAQGKVAEAVTEFRRVIALDPKNSLAYYNLGLAFQTQGNRAEAVNEYRRALAINSRYAPAYGALGEALLQQGQFLEARSATRRCLQLLPAGHPQRQVAARQLQQCRQLLALDRKLTAVLMGKSKSEDPGEQLGLAHLCLRYKQRYASATRFFAAVFASHSQIADDLSAGHRFYAASASARAGCGQGVDAAQLDAQEKARLRGQALKWLGADLVLWGKQMRSDKPAARQAAQLRLRFWKKNPDLAGVREPAALAEFPEAERKAWRKMWGEIDSLLAKFRRKE